MSESEEMEKLAVENCIEKTSLPVCVYPQCQEIGIAMPFAWATPTSRKTCECRPVVLARGLRLVKGLLSNTLCVIDEKMQEQMVLYATYIDGLVHFTYEIYEANKKTPRVGDIVIVTGTVDKFTKDFIQIRNIASIEIRQQSLQNNDLVILQNLPTNHRLEKYRAKIGKLYMKNYKQEDGSSVCRVIFDDDKDETAVILHVDESWLARAE